MNLSDVIQSKRTRKKKRIVGRGKSSGAGKFCGRGMKGFHSRTGNRMNKTLEGGQMPLFRRLPIRGFNNSRFTTRYTPVNLYLLEQGFQDGDTVTGEILLARGLIDKRRDGIKILATGELTKVLTVHANKISNSALQKIQKAGGTVVLPEPVAEKKKKK